MNRMGFGGFPINETVEDIPFGIGNSYQERDISDRLPSNLPGGYKLISFEPIQIPVDPVVLQNKWGHIIYQWSDGETPSWVDVLDVCNKLGLC